MKDMSRRFACLVLALSLCLALLAGCGKDKGGAPDPTPEATKQTFDPAAYVRGGLDAVYLGEYSDEYLAMLGGETKESCDERYERGMQVSLGFSANISALILRSAATPRAPSFLTSCAGCINAQNTRSAPRCRTATATQSP